MILPIVLACLTLGNRILPVNNAQVEKYKQSTPNLFLARAHVLGNITKVYPNKNGHNHFQVTLDDATTIEVIYNTEFGPLPELIPGTNIEACGDYITSNQDTDQYPASPDGAILHWVHKSTRVHLSGYLRFNGHYYGQEN